MDIIGKAYLKEYDSKSSEQFKTLCKQIEKEVRQILLTATYHVLLIWLNSRKVAVKQQNLKKLAK